MLASAAHDLPTGATWRTLAERACVGYAAAKQTVRDMARAGDLVPVGQVTMPHARRPMTLFAPGTRAVQPSKAPQRLADLMRSWPAR